MIKVFALFFTVFYLSGFDAIALSLHSESFCMRAGFRCSHGTDKLYDQNGRCGCLSEDAYHDRKSCRSPQFVCDETKGERFSILKSGTKTVGCGCFSTR